MPGTVLRAAGPLVRGLATSAVRRDKGIFGSFFERKVEPQVAAHSDKLARKERISEISTHNVRPDSIDKYLKAQENLIGFINSQKEVLHGECLGNFNVLIGDQVWTYRIHNGTNGTMGKRDSFSFSMPQLLDLTDGSLRPLGL
jgi:hypothetical protein